MFFLARGVSLEVSLGVSLGDPWAVYQSVPNSAAVWGFVFCGFSRKRWVGCEIASMEAVAWSTRASSPRIETHHSMAGPAYILRLLLAACHR